MKIAIFRLAVLMTSLLTVAPMASAQETPVHSFDLLQIQIGQRLIVKPEEGRSVEGRLVSRIGNELAIERRRWNFKKERKVFTEQSVRRVELMDSTLNGTLIGAGVGLLGSAVVYETCESLGCVLPFTLSSVLGPLLGQAIDATHNRALYTSDRGARITFSPVVAPHRLGLSAQIRFGRE